MRLLRTRWSLVVLALVLIGGTGLYLRARTASATGPTTMAAVQRGRFDVVVTTSGELRAREFVEVTVPAGAQEAEAYQMKIASIVPEGTVVQKGDIVAELDRSTLANKLAEVNLAMVKAQAVAEQAMLDSTLTLSKARDDIRNLELGLEEKKLVAEQSTYETPAVKRQAAIDLEKADRALVQAKADYLTRSEQSRAKMREVATDLERQKNKLQAVQNIMGEFTIKAPTAGMVIYVKEWNGRKRTTGSQVSTWDPGVATLPDLTQMESITYVNEIDIRKIATGQKVALTLDSDPDRKLTGTVAAVANVGEQRPNTDAKVFEVKVTVAGSDTTLRPGMTTGNAIVTTSIEDALFIPLEAMNSENGVPYVYRVAGGKTTRQEIVTGAMNENEIVVLKGLGDGDNVLLVPPVDGDAMPLLRLPDSPVTGLPGDSGKAGAAPLPKTDPKADSGKTGSDKPDSSRTAPKPATPDTGAVLLARAGY